MSALPALVFGPVPSRRLGRSLGVNNIPPKLCSYCCVYCQLGRTLEVRTERSAFYPPDSIERAVRSRIDEIAASGGALDYVTFVSDGEPTLDTRLGETLALLRPLGVPLAVISNSSLADQPEVREALQLADWVSLKVDAADAAVWRSVDRPHRHLSLPAILAGIRTFAETFRGRLVTESMLVAGCNDAEGHLLDLATFLADIRPQTAYLSVPTRPPAEDWVRPPNEESLARAVAIVESKGLRVECLAGYEGDDFAHSGDAVADVLATTAVHPMREEALREFLRQADKDWAVVGRLVADGMLRRVSYRDQVFYVRRLVRGW